MGENRLAVGVLNNLTFYAIIPSIRKLDRGRQVFALDKPNVPANRALNRHKLTTYQQF
jgi:hypothetical protein